MRSCLELCKKICAFFLRVIQFHRLSLNSKKSEKWQPGANIHRDGHEEKQYFRSGSFANWPKTVWSKVVRWDAEIPDAENRKKLTRLHKKEWDNEIRRLTFYKFYVWWILHKFDKFVKDSWNEKLTMKTTKESRVIQDLKLSGKKYSLKNNRFKPYGVFSKVSSFKEWHFYSSETRVILKC